MSYRIEITYAAGGEPQVHTGLSAERAEIGAGACLRDLIHLDGRGVRQLVVEKEGTDEEG